MSYQLKKLETGEVEVEVIISSADLKTESSWAAARLSKNMKIPGFRPGKVPYDIVKKELGEMKILEEAANKLIIGKLNEILATEAQKAKADKKENFEIAGQPNIEIKKLAPGNDLVFKATLPLFPWLTLPDFNKIKVAACQPKLEKRELADKLNEIINNLRQLHVKEILEKRAAKKGDKVQFDLEVKVAGKIIDNGQAEKYNVIIGQDQMIPGFPDQLIGMEENEEKEFTLKLPENSIQALAGKNLSPDSFPEVLTRGESLAKGEASFKVKCQGVYKRELPEPNNDFAKSCGAKNLEDLKKQINENLQKEAENKAQEKQEIEILEKVIENTKFGPLAPILIEKEQHQVLHELRFQIKQSGGQFEDYLKHIKKSQEELKQTLRPAAEKRLKTQLIFRQIIKDNKFEPDQKRINEEIKKAESLYRSRPEILEKIKSDSYRYYVESLNLNRQVTDWLKKRLNV